MRSPGLEGGERDELGLVVVEEAQRLSALVDKLLDLSRLQAGAAEPRRDWCSLEEVVRTAASDVCPEDDASFALSFDPDLPLVQADAAQLERVFVNLLENARRYSGGHPVKVRARVVGGKMSIRVIDRGPGMTPAQLARAFEPFYRDAASDTHPGSGLGLAIVRGFVEANGGRVRAESLPGHGTVFAIELPLADPPVPATAGTGVNGPRLRVLVCDDELQILRGLRIVLREAGFDVVAAQSAQERSTPRRCTRPRRRSSTSCCPTATASTSAASCAPGVRCRSSCSRRSATRR